MGIDTRLTGPAARLVRPARPQGSVDLVGALVATALAAVALVAALVLEVSPPRALAAVVVAIVPVLGLVALPVVRARSRAQDDDALRWFGAGLGVAVTTAVLQAISFPLVPDGGPRGSCSGRSPPCPPTPSASTPSC